MKIRIEHSDFEILKELGQRLRNERINLQLTQRELAQRIGVSTTTIQKAENSGTCTLSTLVKILRELRQIGCLNAILENSEMYALFNQPTETSLPQRVRKVKRLIFNNQ